MSQINPPPSDEVLDRHRFYATVATSLSHDKEQDEAAVQTRTRLHQRVDEVAKIATAAADALTEIKTQARTLASIASVLWVVLGGLIAWSLDKTVTKVDTFITTINKHDQAIEDMKKDLLTLQSQKESVDSLKRVVGTLQSEIEVLQSGKK